MFCRIVGQFYLCLFRVLWEAVNQEGKKNEREGKKRVLGFLKVGQQPKTLNLGARK